jgi:hypothetical protein
MHISVRSVVGSEVARDFWDRVNGASALAGDPELPKRFWDRVTAEIPAYSQAAVMWAALYRIWQDECRGVAWPSEFRQITK